MTVVAYSAKHRIMAADSRCNDEHSMHLTTCKKIFRLKNGALYGGSGDDDDRDIRALLSRATPGKMPSRMALAETKTSCASILVFPKGQMFVVDVDFIEHANEGEWLGSVSPIQDHIVAIGHGQQYAYGVLELGGDPRDAVRITCKRDTTCALPVQWEKL